MAQIIAFKGNPGLTKQHSLVSESIEGIIAASTNGFRGFSAMQPWQLLQASIHAFH